MKKLFILIVIIFLSLTFIQSKAFSQDTLIYDKNSVDYEYSSSIKTERLLDVTPFPCSCHCSTMVKSADIFQDQTDSELYLYGGYVQTIPHLDCQRIELNITACNNQSIPSLSISFPPSNDDCFSENFYFYRDNTGDGTDVIMTDNFDPKTSSGLMTFNPPIPPCSSRKVIFYICSKKMVECEGDDYSVEIAVNGQNPTCNKTMTWHFDFITEQKNYKIDINLNDFNLGCNKIAHEYIYKIIDVYQNNIVIGKINDYSEIYNIKRNLKLENGLYLLQIIDKDKVIYQEKFIKGY
jgi:hypothetical protein